MHLHCWQYATNKHTRNTFSEGGIKWAVHENCELCCECKDVRQMGERTPIYNAACIRCGVVPGLPIESYKVQIGVAINTHVDLCHMCLTFLADAVRVALTPKEAAAKDPQNPKQRSILLDG